MRASFTLALVLALGCGDDDDRADVDAFVADSAMPMDASSDGGSDDDAFIPDGGPEVCVREAAPADRARFVVVAHPFVPNYEVLALDTDGALTRPGTTFLMGKAAEAPIVFTADGEIGIVPQDDGSLGVFRIDASGDVDVVHASYEGEFYASRVVMDPDGNTAWVLDSQWRESGGGLYRIEFDCDGRIVNETMVAPSRLAYGMGFEADGSAIIAAKDILSTTLGPDVHRVDLTGPTVDASAEVFADDDWIVAGFDLTASHAFLGDNAGFSATPNSVAVVGLGETALQELQTVPVEDPASILASPFDDVVLVVSAFGDAIFEFGYDPGEPEPLTARGELSYTTRGPALPTVGTMLRRGSLEGLAFVAENVAVRRIQFEGGGVVTDLGPFELGEGLESIAGAIGVQP
ncbi:MAG: hypothetical protein JJ863_16005 [Deltaproteobacteria bacterium]|nr:hypothetical protein [Deltaproteobacteria bacterium]